MIMGFTGNRKGMTLNQRETFQRLVQAVAPEGFHHGACVGSDEQAVVLVRYFIPKDRVVAHPASAGYMTSSEAIRLSGVIRDPEPYLDRNKSIVRDSWVLVATPEQPAEIMRSGTWATVRYGRAARHPVFVIAPDGRIEIQ